MPESPPTVGSLVIAVADGLNHAYQSGHDRDTLTWLAAWVGEALDPETRRVFDYVASMGGLPLDGDDE